MKKPKIIAFIFFYLFLFDVNAKSINNDILNKISKNIRCLICQGQSIYDSQSDFAESMRIVINNKLEQGSTENEIYEFLINQYGEWIIYDPSFNKNTIFLWLLPIFIFFFGGLLILKKTRIFKL